MDRTKLIEALARSIAANAEVIAMNPNDWPDSLHARASTISADATKLLAAIQDQISRGGHR